MTTLEKKLHIAGEPKGKIQRCTRCGALLTHNKRPDETSFWTPGATVMSYRYGKLLVQKPEDAVGIRLCGRKSIGMKLSNQALWYLAGNFPVYVKPAVGHAAPEPKAMQELVDAGICTLVKGIMGGDYWTLTQATPMG
jgi:hypothetical protein